MAIRIGGFTVKDRNTAEGEATKPTAESFGTSGTLTSYGGSGNLYLTAGTYENYDFGSRTVIADSEGVTIRNCKGGSFGSYYGNFWLEDTESYGVFVDAYYRNIDDVTIKGCKVIGTDGDGLDIFSSDSGLITNVLIDGFYAAGFDFSSNHEAHGDGIQIRGIDGCTIRNATVDMGPWQEFSDGYKPKNAALYFEVVQRLEGIVIEDVWLNGGGYTFYTAPGSSCSATRMHVDGNDYGYGPILIEGGRPGGWTLTDCTGPDGNPL